MYVYICIHIERGMKSSCDAASSKSCPTCSRDQSVGYATVVSHGCLAHKQPPCPEEHHMTLCIYYARILGGGGSL